MRWPFARFEPERVPRRSPRLKRVSVRSLIPNMVTLLALCVGLTAIRMALEERFADAILAIIVAGILDGIDGRVARLLRSASRFGAELDSLTDFVNFGVAPAVVLYAWGLQDLRSLGWIGVLVFSICAALRLARFNVALDDQNKPRWMQNYFVGVPAPAGAAIVLLPIYLDFLGLPRFSLTGGAVVLYAVLVGLLMASRIPTFSGKLIGQRIDRDLVVPLFVATVLFVGLLVSFPWTVLALGTVAYFAAIPLSVGRYRQHWAADRRATGDIPPPDEVVSGEGEGGESEERPDDSSPGA
jgi:CDP-diacylglycerol--serine O-phosphatidyltransferase